MKETDMMKKIASESPFTSMEKKENNSSQLSGSSSQWDLEESCIASDHPNHDGRMRQSSWDNSDNDLSPGHEKNPEPSRLYSDDSTQFRGSVTFEINELKKQFFETLEKMKDENDGEEFENLRDKIESKLNSDRRQSPARMRRRTKSSSSSSPILESKSHNSPNKIDMLNEAEAVFEDIPTKALEFDQKFYLNNFFTEIRSKRISMMDSTSGINNIQEPTNYESECIQTSNEIISPDSNENDDYFCQTSRKLSKILEVEENKTDLEKSSEEKIDNSEFFSKTVKNPEEEELISPLQTARSRKSQKAAKKEEKYKSLSNEEFGNYSGVEKTFQGSLSERTTKIFNHKLKDNFTSLSTKSEKSQMNSLNNQKLYLSPKEANKDFSTEPNFEAEEKEKKSGSQECLHIDMMKGLLFENFTPRKSTDRSEGTRTSRSMSAKSRRSANSDRQMFLINIGKDSDRSLRIEDVNTPDSSKKNSKSKTHSELKTLSLDDCSPSTSKKYSKFTDRTEDGSESKRERNLQKLQSPNVESVKSSYRSSKEQDMNYLKSHRSFQTSHRKKKKQKQNDQNMNFETNESNLAFAMEKAESSSSIESNTSCGSSHNKSSRSGSFIKIINIDISNENQSSFRSLKFGEKRSLKAEEDDELYDQEISKNDEILELGLPLEILKGPKSGNESCRSAKTIELDPLTKDSETSETNLLQRTSRRAHERCLSSRSRNMESKRSTPRSLKISSRTNSGSSNRSKDSLENRDDTGNSERLRTATWKKLEKICDIVQNPSSVSSASSKSSWRESETSDQQNFCRKKLFSSEADGSDVIIRHKNNDTSKEQLPRRRKNSEKFPDSQIIDSPENNNSDSSIKTTSRPTSWISEEHKTSHIHPEVEKLNMDEKNIDRFFLFKEDEDQEKGSPVQKYESGTESDRNSNKRLSIINEVSFENLKVSSENEEEDKCEYSRKYSKRSNSPDSPQNVKKTPNSLVDFPPKADNLDGGKWNELIEKFGPNPNSSCDLEDTFHRLSQKKGNSFDSARDVTLEKNTASNGYFENQVGLSTLSKSLEKEYESLENNLSYEKVFEEKEANNLEYKEPLLKKDLKEKDFHVMHNSQNLFYFNLSREGPFGIGEFGDVTCWNACKSNTIDSEKPKDHGDGAQTQKNSEVLILPEKRVNEAKTQRNLWTELRTDFRDSKPLLNTLFPEAEDHMDLSNFVPIGLKTSKSDNCLKSKTNAGSDFENPPTCKFLPEYNGMPKKIIENEFLEFESSKKINTEVKSTSESVTEKHLSLESLEFEKEDSDNQEFECEITPRLSISLSNFEAPFQEDSFISRDSNESFTTSRTQLFEKKTDSRKHENEMTDLNIFLAPNEKKEKIIPKSNWLNLKNPGKEKSREKNQKVKKKIKNKSSPKEPFHGYLYPRKRMSNVSQLKLRNSNCFQNFYKRFISVFCLTSHSSSATSK